MLNDMVHFSTKKASDMGDETPKMFYSKPKFFVCETLNLVYQFPVN